MGILPFGSPGAYPLPPRTLATTVRTAIGNLNGNSIPDYVAIQRGGPGVTIALVLYDDGAEVVPLVAFPGFGGDVDVDLGDVNGDTRDDIVLGAGPGGGPHVRVFEGHTRRELMSFFAYHPHFTGGVSVAVADLTGDEFAEVITGAGPGGGPHVRAFLYDPEKVSPYEPKSILEEMPFPGFAGGVDVSAGDLDGDPHRIAEIVVAAGPGGGPHVIVLDSFGRQQSSFFVPYLDWFYTGGLRTAVTDVDEDGVSEILVGTGGSQPTSLGVVTSNGVQKGDLFYPNLTQFTPNGLYPAAW